MQIQIMAGTEGGALLSQGPQGIEIFFDWGISSETHSWLERILVYIEGSLSVSCAQSRYYGSSNFLQSLHCWCEEVLFPQNDQAFFFWKCWLDANFHDISMSNFHFEVIFWWIVQFHISFLFDLICMGLLLDFLVPKKRIKTRGAGESSFAVCCFPRFLISASETDMFQGPTTRLATKVVGQRSPELQKCCSPYIHRFLLDYCHSRSVVFWLCRRSLPKGSSQISRLGPY